MGATVFEGRVARVHQPGDSLRYSWGEEHRDADELARIVDQLVGVKVYAPHPTSMPAAKSGAPVIGHIVGARVDGDHVVATIIITDAVVNQAIKTGTRELSLGYECRTDEQGYQRETRVDHLAIVERARCGSTCALRTDTDGGTCTCNSRAMSYSVENVSVVDQHNANPTAPVAGREEKIMDEITIKLTEALTEVAKQKARADEFEARAIKAEQTATDALAAKTAAEVEATNARKDADAEKTRAVEAEAKAKTDLDKARTDATESAKTAVRARVLLETQAVGVLGDADRTALSDRDIKIAVIKHVDGDDVPTDKPDLYVDGVYEGAVKRHAKGAASRTNARVSIQAARVDASEGIASLTDENAAKAAMNERTSTAWARTE